MCGICGIILEEHTDSNFLVGELLYKMMESQQVRAQDSAGVAIYNNDNNCQSTPFTNLAYLIKCENEYELREEKTTSFEKIFEVCQDRIHALFLFLSLLELSQQKYLSIITGEGRNNFIVEYNENREEDESNTLDYNAMTSFN